MVKVIYLDSCCFNCILVCITLALIGLIVNV